MADSEIVKEIQAALETMPTGPDGSCFVSNEALPLLERHRRDLLPAIEEVVRESGFEARVRDEWLIESNLHHLMLIYFEQSDDLGWDSVSFLRSLQGRSLHMALVAVRQIGGMSGQARWRHRMPRALYELAHQLSMQDPEFSDRERLSRHVANGSLSLVEETKALRASNAPAG